MALIRCEECGSMVSDKASVCPKCGAPVMAPVKCDECGEMISPLVVSCPNCGAPVDSSVIKCDECGKMIPQGSQSCPHCGYSLFHGEFPEFQSNKELNYIVSEEVNRFNWGAFFLWVFWGCANGMPYTIIIWFVLIILNAFTQYSALHGSGNYFPWIFLQLISTIIAFDFGLNGGKWAWQKKKWRDFEHYREVQRSWRHWALGLFFTFLFIGSIVAFLYIMSRINK